MRYNHNDMLPEDAFKKDPLGRIKLHGGGGGGGGTAYNPYKDKQYKEQKAFLDTLKADIEKNQKKMTPEEIIAALTPGQRDIIAQQGQITQPSYTGGWGFMNNTPVSQPQPVMPQAIPQVPVTGFGYNPQQLSAIQQLLANSSFVPNAGNVGNISNPGNIGGR